MNFTPLRDTVVIRQVAKITERGGVLLPEHLQHKPREGEVVAVGPGRRDSRGERVPMTLKPGDRVFWALGKGAKWKTPEGVFLLMKETDVMGAIER